MRDPNPNIKSFAMFDAMCRACLDRVSASSPPGEPFRCTLHVHPATFIRLVTALDPKAADKLCGFKESSMGGFLGRLVFPMEASGVAAKLEGSNLCMI